jgi:hypothetical protein
MDQKEDDKSDGCLMIGKMQVNTQRYTYMFRDPPATDLWI